MRLFETAKVCNSPQQPQSRFELTEVQNVSRHHSVQRLANLILAIGSAYVCFNSPSRESLGHIVSDVLCLRMWRIHWIGNIAQTVLRSVSHSPFGRWLCVSPRIVFVPLIKAHCYLHDNPVRAAFCFGALQDYLFHTPVPPRQSAEAGGQEGKTCDTHREAEQTQKETDRAPPPSVAGLIDKAFDTSKRYFELSVELADYAGDLLMHTLGFEISRKHIVTFKELRTRNLELLKEYYQTLNQLNTAEKERTREHRDQAETLAQLVELQKERKTETREYLEVFDQLTTTQKSCIAALEERNALLEANRELRTGFEDLSRRLEELEQKKQLEEPAGAWGRHLNWIPSKVPKSKLDPAGKKERG